MATGIQPHQQIYMITSELMRRGKIRSRKTGREWVFYIGETTEEVLSSPGKAPPGTTTPSLSATQFEKLARRVFSMYIGVTLNESQVPGVPKLFDFVSPNGSIVGDAQCFTLLGEYRLPPAKYSVIAEHVWLLKKTGANRKFLVFGNDREVPIRCLAGGTALAPQKYPSTRDFEAMVVRRLVYFKRAEMEEPLPMLKPVSWQQVKAFFREQAIVLGRGWLE